MDKPDVDFIEGLSPAISIDQKSASRNPRSTVGTITEIYDYLRLLYARVGIPHCPEDGTVVQRQTPQQIVDRILELPDGTRFQVLAPVVRGRKGEYQSLLEELAGQGYARARIDGEVHELSDPPKLARYEIHTIEVVVDRLVKRPGIERRLTDSLETALRLAEGVAEVQLVARDDEPPPGRRHADLQPAPGLPDVRAVVRRAGAPQLQLQLALRGLPELRRPGHPLRGRPRAGRPGPRSVDRGGSHHPVGRGREASTSAGCWRRWPRPRAFRRRTPWRNLKKADQKVVLYGIGHQAGPRPVPQPVRAGRAATRPTTRGWFRGWPGGTPKPIPTTPARPSRATCGRCPARNAAGPGSSPRAWR